MLTGWIDRKSKLLFESMPSLLVLVAGRALYRDDWKYIWHFCMYVYQHVCLLFSIMHVNAIIHRVMTNWTVHISKQLEKFEFKELNIICSVFH